MEKESWQGTKWIRKLCFWERFIDKKMDVIYSLHDKFLPASCCVVLLLSSLIHSHHHPGHPFPLFLLSLLLKPQSAFSKYRVKWVLIHPTDASGLKWESFCWRCSAQFKAISPVSLIKDMEKISRPGQEGKKVSSKINANLRKKKIYKQMARNCFYVSIHWG